MKVSILRAHKSIQKVQDFILPDFVVLTGKNGSGKTHLMQAMSESFVCRVSDDEGKPLSRVKYIPFNGLNPSVVDNCDYLGLANNRKQAWKQIQQYITEYKNLKNSGWDIKRYLNSDSNKKRFLGKWVELANGDVDVITESFFIDNYEVAIDDMFSGQFAAVFMQYQTHLVNNEFKKFQNNNLNRHKKVLSDEEFVKLHGPKPWDLINNMLRKAGLTYQVNYPEEGEKELDFKLHLTDIDSGVEIKVGDLSTGEKVLMSLALSIYNSKEESARPDLLLLDEPDAALHPEYSRVLIESIYESIVKDAKVKVIISTHSPMTVAISPEESIFLMDKKLGKPKQLTRQDAVNILTRDLDNVRLSYENRRQVFVESQFDVQYYKRIYSLLECKFPTVPQFLAPRSGKKEGSNCDDVSIMVNQLRHYGNDLVYGIKDFDKKNYASEYVFVLGEGNRYAIENYIFDPLYVAILLIRESVLSTETIELPKLSFSRLRELSDLELQTLIDHVVDKLGLKTNNVVDYTVVGNKSFKATRDYFLMKGHDLEEAIMNKWPQLKGLVRGGDNALKNYMLDRVWRDFPEFVSTDFVDLFMKIK